MSHTPASFKCVSPSPDERVGDKGAPALSRRAVLMLGVSFSLGSSLLWRKAHGSAQKATLSAIFIGQSEQVYWTRFDGGNMTPPVLPSVLATEPNLQICVVTANDEVPELTTVTPGNVASGFVNPAIGALSGFLHYVTPGRKYAFGCCGISGVGRRTFFDDSDDSRKFSDFVSVVELMRGEFGEPDILGECWYGADRAMFSTEGFAFFNNYSAGYFGVNPDFSPFEIGVDTVTIGGTERNVDHCIWDALAPVDEVGRGILTKETKWRFLGAMPRVSEIPDADATPPEAEYLDFSTNADGSPIGGFRQPARQNLRGFESNPVAQTVDFKYGPSAHVQFHSANDPLHPAQGDPDGICRFAMTYGLMLLREAGVPILEPKIIGIEGPEDGTYADIIVDLPNGGTLTTIRQFRNEALPATPSPHQQEVTGFETFRGEAQNVRPIWRADETGRPASERGTVEIIDSGSGTPKRGVVRITPVEPFGFQEGVAYLRGGSGAAILRPRDLDNRLYKDMLIEHVPLLYNPDAGAGFGYEGIAVEPFQVRLAAPVPVAEGPTISVFEDYSDYPAGPLADREGWTTPNQSLVVVDGVAKRLATGGLYENVRTEEWPSDQEATVTSQNADASNGNSRIIVQLRRGGDLLSFYEFSLRRRGEWRLDRVIDGTPTTLAMGDVGNSGTMTLRLRAVGEQITAWINGTQVSDVTDTGTTILTGRPAMSIFKAGNAGSQANDAENSRVLTFAASNAS